MRTTKVTKSADQALQSLMALCARAEKSSGDARRLMDRWGVERGEQEVVLQRLIEEHFIDDARFATLYIREKCNLSGWGEFKIRAALQNKGIAREIIEERIMELDPADMQSRLEQSLHRKMSRVKCENQHQLRNKLLRYGASLGYSFDQLRDAIDKLIDEEM